MKLFIRKKREFIRDVSFSKEKNLFVYKSMLLHAICTYMCVILNKITLWLFLLMCSKDPRYNIILLMPTDKTDTHRLARDLSGKSLRSLRKRLQPTWVRATIPSFMLRGFVTLTSFLQRVSEQ